MSYGITPRSEGLPWDVSRDLRRSKRAHARKLAEASSIKPWTHILQESRAHLSQLWNHYFTSRLNWGSLESRAKHGAHTLDFTRNPKQNSRKLSWKLCGSQPCHINGGSFGPPSRKQAFHKLWVCFHPAGSLLPSCLGERWGTPQAPTGKPRQAAKPLKVEHPGFHREGMPWGSRGLDVFPMAAVRGAPRETGWKDPRSFRGWEDPRSYPERPVGPQELPREAGRTPEGKPFPWERKRKRSVFASRLSHGRSFEVKPQSRKRFP